MNVLILGINGFLGPAIAASVTAQGQHVIGLARSSTCTFDREITYIAGDRCDFALIQHALAERKIDVVIDIIPMTMRSTEPLLACLDGSIGQYIMISSSDVYANYELLHRRATGVATAHEVDESSSLRSTKYPYRGHDPRAADDPDKFLDGYDKIPIEIAVQQLSCAWTIMRLPMVYGPGDKQHRFRWCISPMLRGAERLVIPTNWSHWVSTYGYSENVGAAIALAIDHPSAKNRVFNVAESRPVSQLEWAKKFARILDWDGVIETTDDPDDPIARRVSNLDLTVPFKITGKRIRDELGYTDLVDEATGLERTVASEAERKPARSQSVDF